MVIGAVIGEDGQVPLPWLQAPLRAALRQQGHALLLVGAGGSGAYELAMALAQSRLCESPGPDGLACGRCAACHLLRAGTHPDLHRLLPEALRATLDPAAAVAPEEGIDAGGGRRKPSRQIRIDEVRRAIDWIVSTPARGRAKMLVLHPAEAMNPASASALLKTLEEPPASARIVLTCSDAAHLLPTVRSRCQHLAVALPPPPEAQAWLRSKGVADADVLLTACGGAPLQALELAQAGVDARAWASLPAAVAGARREVFGGWPLARLIDALQKLCHDASAVAAGATPRYFRPDELPGAADPQELAAWWQALLRAARHDEHPWNEALLVESLLRQGARALQGRRTQGSLRGSADATLRA